MLKEYITLEVWEWSEWVEDIVNRLKGELKYDINGDPFSDITVEDLLFSPSLDPENPQPFCASHMLSGSIYENRILVKHHKDKDSFWMINSDDTCLLYKPKQVNKD